jgi:hypothetical protein
MGEDVTNRIQELLDPPVVTNFIADTTHRILPEIFSLLDTIPGVVTKA